MADRAQAGHRSADGSLMPSAPTPGTGGDRRARWRVVAAGGVVAGVGATVYYLSSDGAQSRVWELTIAVLLIVMAWGIWRFQTGQRSAWFAIWLGLTSAFLGGFLATHPGLAPFDVTSPSVVDALRLGNYPLGAAGILVLLFRADRRVGTRAMLEAAIAVAAGTLLIWVLVVEPLVADSTRSGVGLVVAVLYPVMDVLLLAVLAVLIVRLSHRPGALLLVALALAGNLAADVAFSYQELHGGFAPGGLIDVGWLLCFASLAVAPAWPLATRPRPAGDDGRLNAGRSIFLAAGALLAPAIALVQLDDGEGPDGVVVVAGFALVVMVLLRLGVFNRDLDLSRSEVAALADRLGDANRDLEQARDDQRRLLDRIHRAVEEERTRIAADIHDRPLQHLTGIGYQLERINLLLGRGDTEAASGLCDRAAGQLAEQLTELRVLMTTIRPPVLDERGLVGALDDRAAQLREEHPDLEVDVRGDGDRVHPDVETALYRVAQEALQNVVRHADASSVQIEVSRAGERIMLSVVDDGRGFAPATLTELLGAGRFGIAGMGERVQLLGGSMSIDSRPGRGTAIAFTLPAIPSPMMSDLVLEAAP
jgi:signal transduction histidine kinase